MLQEANTICIRCGKVRIFLRRWKDKENGKGTLITHEQTVCPDVNCQKIVDEKFKEMLDRRTLSENRKKSVVLARSTKIKVI